MIDISTDDTFDGMFFTTEWSTQECPVSSPALSDGLHENVPIHRLPSAMVYTRMSRFITCPQQWSTRECPVSSPALSDGLHENVPIHHLPSAMVYTRMSRFIARPRRWSTRECPDSSPALGDGLHENVPFHHSPLAMVYTRMSRFIARPRRWSTRECRSARCHHYTLWTCFWPPALADVASSSYCMLGRLAMARACSYCRARL